MAESNYYLRLQRNPADVRGPLSRRQIHDLIQAGKLRPEDEVSLDRAKWAPLIKVAPKSFQSIPIQEQVLVDRSDRLKAGHDKSKSTSQTVTEATPTPEVESETSHRIEPTVIPTSPAATVPAKVNSLPDESISDTSTSRQAESVLSNAAIRPEVPKTPPPLPSSPPDLLPSVADSSLMDAPSSENSENEVLNPPLENLNPTPGVQIEAVNGRQLGALLEKRGRQIGQRATDLARRANSSLRGSVFLADLESLLAWNPSTPGRVESTTAMWSLVLIGLAIQLRQILMPGTGISTSLQVWGLVLTPVFAAGHLIAAVSLANLFGVAVDWRSGPLKREVTYTGLLMGISGLLEMAVQAYEAPHDWEVILTLIPSLLLYIHIKCVLYMRFVVARSGIPAPQRTRVITWGVSGLLATTITSTLVIATIGALFQKTEPNRYRPEYNYRMLDRRFGG